MRRALATAIGLSLMFATQAGAAERDQTWRLVSLNGTATAKVTNTSWECRRTGGDGRYITKASFDTDFRVRQFRGSNIFGYPTRGALIPTGSATPAFTQTTAASTDWNHFETSSGSNRQCEPQPQPTCAGTTTLNTTGLLIEEGSFMVRRKNRREVYVGWPLVLHHHPEDCSVQPAINELGRWVTTMPVRKWKGRRITIEINRSEVIRDLELSADAKHDVELTYTATAKLRRNR